jgi:chitin synthase
LSGKIDGITLHLSTSGLDVSQGLLHIPSERGHRVFEVFYYLLSAAATPAEREALGLGQPADYALLRKSGTYEAASYLPTADDAASAEIFRDALRSIGISGRLRRDLLSLLAGLLKLGDSLGLLVTEAELELICEEAAALLGVEADLLSRQFDDAQREVIIEGVYEAVVDWVIRKANKAIAEEIQDHSDRLSSESDSRQAILTPTMSDEDTVSLTVIEIPDVELAKAVCMRTIRLVSIRSSEVMVCGCHLFGTLYRKN